MSKHTEISSQPSHVFRPEQMPSKDRGGGARTIPLATSARGATSFLNGVTIFSPGAQIAHHTHNVAESVMVVSGRAIVDIDGARSELETFDTTFVPANIPHHFENASSAEEMRILWTYGSLEASRTIVATGERGRVDAEQAVAAEDPVDTVREIAMLHVLVGHEDAFEAAVAEASPLFQRAHGARGLHLERCLEEPRKYRLVVVWESVEDHLEGFRSSPAFTQWRELVGPHLATAPEAEHVQTVLTAF